MLKVYNVHIGEPLEVLPNQEMNFSQSCSGSGSDWNRFARKFVVIVGGKRRIKLCLYLNWFHRKWDKVGGPGTSYVCPGNMLPVSQVGLLDPTWFDTWSYSQNALMGFFHTWYFRAPGIHKDLPLRTYKQAILRPRYEIAMNLWKTHFYGMSLPIQIILLSTVLTPHAGLISYM